MSLSPLSSAATNVLPALNLHPHGHQKGARPDQSSSSSTLAAQVAAVMAAAPAGTTHTAANVQAFMHSLFQALKQDGLGGSPSSLASSLQTLVRQMGQPGNPTSANLNASYQNLMKGAVSGTGATSAGATGSLQHFLDNLLQNVQSDGIHSLSGIGNIVNANA